MPESRSVVPSACWCDSSVGWLPWPWRQTPTPNHQTRGNAAHAPQHRLNRPDADVNTHMLRPIQLVCTRPLHMHSASAELSLIPGKGCVLARRARRAGQPWLLGPRPYPPPPWAIRRLCWDYSTVLSSSTVYKPHHAALGNESLSVQVRLSTSLPSVLSGSTAKYPSRSSWNLGKRRGA